MNNSVKPNFKVKSMLVCMGFMQSMTLSHLSFADERESLEQLKATTANLIDLLVEEGVLSKNKADAMMKKASEQGARQAKAIAVQAKKEAAGEEIAGDSTIRVQYVPEHVKKKLRDEIKQEVMVQAKDEGWAAPNQIPDWTNRIAFNGDIRLRYENNSFASGNALPTDLNNASRFSGINNSTEDRNRARVRSRLGMDFKVNDWLNGGVRISTGALDNPLTANQTAEFEEGKFVIGLDRAFLKVKPTDWLTIEGGRFANPWLNTDMVWDPDLAFDGVAALGNFEINKNWSTFGTMGVFPVEEIETSNTNLAESKWLYGAQAGLQWESANKSVIRLGVAYYDFTNQEGKPNPTGLDSNNGTVAAYRQKGNNTFDIDDRFGGNSGCGVNEYCRYGLASEFKLINFTGYVDLATFDPVHARLTGDYVRNIGFDQNEILKRTGNVYEEENEGYQVRLDVGTSRFDTFSQNTGKLDGGVKLHDWQVALGYKYIEADAVLDGFNDSNFHLGGTDAKGWVLMANYGLGKNTWLHARYLSSDSISGPPLGIDVLFIDLNARY